MSLARPTTPGYAVPLHPSCVKAENGGAVASENEHDAVEHFRAHTPEVFVADLRRTSVRSEQSLSVILQSAGRGRQTTE